MTVELDKCAAFDHDWEYCCSRVPDWDEGVILEHFTCTQCDDEYEG